LYDEVLKKNLCKDKREVLNNELISEMENISANILENLLKSAAMADLEIKEKQLEILKNREELEKKARRLKDYRPNYSFFEVFAGMVNNGNKKTLPINKAVGASMYFNIFNFLAIRPSLMLTKGFYRPVIEKDSNFYIGTICADIQAQAITRYVNFFTGLGPELWMVIPSGPVMAAGIFAGITPVKFKHFEMDFWARYVNGRIIDFEDAPWPYLTKFFIYGLTARVFK
ncbi:MAG: hypothetical protein ABIA63_07065, partial [bacterium]